MPLNGRPGEKTVFSSLDLAIILYSSPLPPSATLKRLEKSSDIGGGDGILEIARRDELSGTREGLRNYIENKLSELRVRVETTEELIQQLGELMMLFTVSLPLIVVGLVFMVSPGKAAPLLVAFSAIGGLVGAAAYAKIPVELRFPPPGRRALAALSLMAVPLLLEAGGLIRVGEEVFLLVVAASAPSAALTYREAREILGELEGDRRLLVEALRCPFHIFRCLGLDAFEEPVRLRVSRVLREILMLYGRFGRDEEGLRWLVEYFESYRRLLGDVRARTMLSLLNGIVGVSVLALGLSMVSSVFSSLPAVSVAGLSISPVSFARVKPYLDLVLAVNSLSYSVATASMREGNPLYFPLYLPVMLLATYAGLVLGPLLAPR